MAFVMLVDEAGIVRWRAHGAPVEGELDALAAAAETLLRASHDNEARRGGGKRIR